ncbi:hypothetical protein [Amycolatopsis aidingensis]|uniref:hypothetical protein n=1 Tax=Amycolatopsis aidingensis TaxID=2842453 RepID=UPI001C0DB64F|nr:hypothetical protein [Amycolatopsis aidingensis]
MRRKHTPPPQFARLRASKSELAEWSSLTRQARTCYHCRTVYQTSGHATGCEQHHEAGGGAARSATVAR